MATRKTHKVRGATFETEIRNYFRSLGYEAERLARTGAKDEGDVAVRGWLSNANVVIEAKAPGLDGRIDLSGWIRESQLEATHYGEARGLPVRPLPALVIKARGKKIDDAFLVFKLSDMVKLQEGGDDE